MGGATGRSPCPRHPSLPDRQVGRVGSIAFHSLPAPSPSSCVISREWKGKWGGSHPGSQGPTTISGDPPLQPLSRPGLLTRLPAQEPHSVGRAGVALGVAGEPVILATLVDDLNSEVGSVLRPGLGGAEERQSRALSFPFFVKKKGDDSCHKHMLTSLKSSPK